MSSGARLEIDGKVQELGGDAKVPRTWRGAVVSMLPQGAMNSVSPTKRIRTLVYDVMRSHDRKISRDEALDRARERITTLGLPARVLDAYPHQLSGGMKQRTVTIISTLLNPRLLVADEPTSALDVTSQKILIEMLLEMLDKQIISGVIFVTHDLPVLRTVATKIAVMYEGRIIEQGPTEIMVDRPSAPVHAGADELGARAGAQVQQHPDRGNEQLRPFALRRTGGDPPMSAIYTAENITKTFGRGGHQVQAVNDVSFELEEQQVTTIVGESGSGKSTIARMVLGLMPITSGKMIFQDKDVTNLKGRARTEYWRDVQAVFQDPFSSFNQFFTVGKLLARSMRLVGRQVGQQRLEESLGHVGMDLSVLERYPHQLSGGQRQRVMIARALMMQPKLLIADEATSMLDASLRVNILNVLTDLRQELGMTILFITHDIGQACYLADRVLVMEHGSMVEQGTTDEVIFNPQHEYTRRLLADVPKLHTALELEELHEIVEPG